MYKVQGFCIQITVQTGWGEGREERGATPLTCCVGRRSSGQGPPLIPWGEAPQFILNIFFLILYLSTVHPGILYMY